MVVQVLLSCDPRACRLINHSNFATKNNKCSAYNTAPTTQSSGVPSSVPTSVPTIVHPVKSSKSYVVKNNFAFVALNGSNEVLACGNSYHGGDAGTVASPYLSGGVRTICVDDVAFTAITTNGSVIVWGHSLSVSFSGVLVDANPSYISATNCI